MSPESWEEAFRFARPSSDDWVVMQCRTNKRATWAAQLATDAGFNRCLIYKQVAVSYSVMLVQVKVFSFLL